jgi:integrase
MQTGWELVGPCFLVARFGQDRAELRHGGGRQLKQVNPDRKGIESRDRSDIIHDAMNQSFPIDRASTCTDAAVRHSYDDARRMLDTPKSNRDRHIPLDTDMYEMLFKRKQSTGYVFVDTDNNKPFNSPRLNNRLAKICARAGLRRITAHTLRHTFASQLAMKGIPLNLVQTLLGHVSITTTMRYSHFAPSALRSAIEMLSPKTAVNADFGQPVGNQWMQVQNNQELQPISGGR